MAQYVRNSTNYHGARSKTSFTGKEPPEGKSKKDKKKRNEPVNRTINWNNENGRNSYPEGNRFAENSNGAWDNVSNVSSKWITKKARKLRRDAIENKTVWGDIDQDFPPFTPNCATAPKINVWEQRQQKFEELKTLEPSNEDEEEKMIQRALELSKMDVTQEERRKKLEEEYRLQEEMLRSMPNEFSEFFLVEESEGAAAETDFSVSNNYAASLGNDWNSKKYESTVRNDSGSQNVDNWDSFAFSDNRSTNHNQISDGWDEYTEDTNKTPHSSQNFSDSKLPDAWDNVKPKGKTKKQIKIDKSGVWEECNNTESKSSLSKQSDYKSSDIWDTDIDQNGNFSDSDEKQKPTSKTEHYSEERDRKFNRASEKKSYSSRNSGTHQDMSKVADMFGGWGISTNSSRQTHISNNISSQLKALTRNDNTLLSNKSDSVINSKSNKVKEIDSPKTKEYDSNSKIKIPQSSVDELEKKESCTESLKTFISDKSTSHIHDEKVCDSNSFQDFNTADDKLIENDNNAAKDNFNSSAFETADKKTVLSDKYSMPSQNSSESSNFTEISSAEEIVNKKVANNAISSIKFKEDSQASPSFEKHQHFDYTKRNDENQLKFVEKPSSPDVLIDPPKAINHLQSTEPFIHPDQKAYQPVGSANCSTSTSLNESNIKFQENNSFQPNPEQFSAVNISSPIQPTFSYAAPNTLPPVPVNPMIGAFMNPAMFSGVDPIQMQYMLMLQNPYLARNLHMIDMHYRSLGMNPCPPTMGIPQMVGLNIPTFMNPNNNPNQNPIINPPVPISTPIIEHPIINPPTLPSDQKSKQSFSNDSRNSENSNLVFPQPSESANQSIIDSFLPKEKFCEPNKVSVLPPVQPNSQEKNDAEIVYVEESSSGKCDFRFESTTSADNLEDADLLSKYENSTSAINSRSNSVSAASNYSSDKEDALSEASECIGWGDISKNNAKPSFSKWDENTDGWGDNYTTKSMSNPSTFHSNKNRSNRQPSRQPNFNRLRK